MLKRVTKNTSIVSFGTGISMFLGLLRDIMIAHFFGTSALLEAFIVSFRIPNLFRSIFGEGFSDSVATPILSEHRDNKKEILSVGSNLLVLSLFVLAIFTVIGILCARFFVIILAPGFLNDPYKLAMAVSFTRITFLYLIFIGLSVNSFSILYALKKFFIPAITPAFLNVSFIVGLLFFNRFFQEYVLAVCVIGGGILQLVFPFFALKKEGFTLKFSVRNIIRDKTLARMLKLFPARIVSSIVYQLSVIIDTVLASFSHIVGSGAMAALWYANRYVHLPLALFIHPLCRVAIVDLSYQHSRNNMEDFKKLFVFSFQNIIFFIVPIMLTYMAFSDVIIDIVLKRGDFDAYSAAMTASILFFYSFGLFFFCGIKLLVNAFYAIKDTSTPAKITSICLGVNIIMSVILMFPLKIGGVALGSSIAAMINFFMLYRMLIKKIGRIDWQDTLSQFIKVVILSFIVVFLGRLLWSVLDMNKYLKAVSIVSVSASFFIVVGYIVGLKQLYHLRQGILKWMSRDEANL
jgi:putative peptidoglycan lipid II flippase